MGTLYVVGVPAGNPDDLTHRARRVLESVGLWVAADPALALSRLAACGVTATAIPMAAPREGMAALVEGDVALLVDSARATVRDDERRLVTVALEGGIAVVPVPGPALPLTALVVSGLTADSFVYVGELPEGARARDALIEDVVAERRTLLFATSRADVETMVHDLHRALGDRPLFIMSDAGSDQGTWRGTLQSAQEDTEVLPGGSVLALVLGGTTDEPVAWDEARLASEIERRATRGEGAKEISQALAGVSGWSRRAIYRRATERTGTRPHW